MTVANDKPPEQAGAPAAPAWPDRLGALASSFQAWLMRPRVRLSVIGVMLLLVGGLIMTNSVWTLPLVVAGALMVAVAWIGRRLEGRFAVEWGERGTQLAFNATIKAPPAAAAAAAAMADTRTLDSASDVEIQAAVDDVIEGQAHTVEINVSELKALIAAAEAAETPPDPTVRDIRIRRLADEAPRTPRPAG